MNIFKQIYLNQYNRTNFFFNIRKIDNRNKWKNYVIVTRVKLSVETSGNYDSSIFETII